MTRDPRDGAKSLREFAERRRRAAQGFMADAKDEREKGNARYAQIKERSALACLEAAYQADLKADELDPPVEQHEEAS